MSGRIGWLSGLLALQLVIIGVVLFAESGVSESEPGPLLTFDAEAVDELRITGDGENAETLVLTRGDDGWTLPSGLPADDNKIRDVLDKLAGLEAPWPVATSSDAAERFEVTEDKFQRHVVLVADGKAVGELYLGTSPGYQQVHARRGDDDAVYSVALSNYQVPTKGDDWLDKTLLQPHGEVTAIARADAWEITRKDGSWRIGDEPANQEAADDLARRIRELRVTGVAEAPDPDAEPTAVLTVTDSQGPYQLRLYRGDDGSQYRVTSDRRDGAFKLSGYLGDQLLPEQDALVAAADESAQDEAAEDGEADAAEERADAAAPETTASENRPQQEPGA